MPPNRLTTPSVSRIGRPRSVAVSAGSLTQHHLLALPEHPLRPQSNHQDQDDAHDRETEGRDPGLRERWVRQPDESGPLEHDPEDHRTDEDAPVAGQAAEDEDPVSEERNQGLVVLRMDRREVEGQEPSGDRAY